MTILLFLLWKIKQKTLVQDLCRSATTEAQESGSMACPADQIAHRVLRNCSKIGDRFVEQFDIGPAVLHTDDGAFVFHA